MANFNGTSGDDIFTGGADSDTAVGNGGNDTLSGGDNNDLLVGNAGADTLDGGQGNDTLYSGDESPPFNIPYYDNPYTPPLLDTGSEVDTLRGGDGDDRLFAGYGDNVDGGPGGNDYLYISFMGASSGVTADFRLASQAIGGGTITGIENISWVQGSNFDDDINVATSFGTGYSDFTAVFGMGGNDHLVAGYYAGVLDGGDGNDIVDGRGSQYLQKVVGGAGDDTLYTNSNTFATAYGGDGNDTIYSHGTTYGGTGNDLIVMSFSYYGGIVYGEDGNDEIRAATSGTVMAGGNGADILTGDSAVDTISSAGILNSFTLLDDMGLEHDVLTGFGGNDILAAGYGDDVDGGSGTDSLRLSLGGAAGGVTFDTAGIVAGTPFVFAGGTINSIETLAYLRGSEFADTLNLATQAQLLTVDAGAGDDLIVSHGSSVSVSGGNGDDRFISGPAGDTFDGGAGTDTVDYQAYGSAVTVSLGLAAGSTGSGAGGDQLINVENVDGSALGDTINGSDQANVLSGYDGNDTLRGKGGNDALIGGAGSDTMEGGLGNDIYYVDAAGDVVTELSGEGRDVVYTSVSYGLGAGSYVDVLSTASQGATTPLELIGNALGQEIYGNAGANFLDGGGGADYLAGLGGNDTYVVDTASVVAEGAGQGRDVAYARSDYTLAAGAEVEILSAISQAATTPLQLIGNEFRQEMYGNAGANFIDGGTGDEDYMAGFGGNDTYIVDHGSDYIAEALGGGRDVVYAKVSYTLTPGAEVEVLSVISQGAGVVIDLTGNELVNELYGNTESNFLDGGGGADYLQGFAGNDSYVVETQGDVVVEGAGEGSHDVVYARASYVLAAGQGIEVLSALSQGATTAIDLTGNNLANELYGNAGANTLNGGSGADYLMGYGGADTFAFTTALGAGNVDHVGDFLAVDDTIALDHNIFTGLGLGALNANAFVTGTAAGDADDRIIYDQATGSLYYDADGNGGQAQMLFAVLDTHPVITASDFTVI